MRTGILWLRQNTAGVGRRYEAYRFPHCALKPYRCRSIKRGPRHGPGNLARTAKVPSRDRRGCGSEEGQ
jgi:hypothetical protein